ncbi:cytochrome b/b6 domain-containing protein [Noviherbaspirillum sp. UKPF54]|uniref:cytochrome b/b6 domain-containing protein n=1 Tax=Noviherbaspirillum sp. UKPF54 TaxID=2601898 RepID=UPI0011B1BCFC|nr:cytochrome b/b6 domain-containing protein [Noviherbaspirillum sp. UKPF54]QDZ29768.1 cytochrome B [Noviherbaspirillum sp. UKPF54]
MKTTSVSRADAPATAPETGADPQARRILVWDAPVRVFHWLMVLSFAGAYLTAESERWRLVHVSLGYTMAGLVVFRILWGVVGTRYARFSDFVRGPGAVMRYLGSLLRGRPEHHTGHNPAGALAIVALLALTALVTAAGWATYNEIGGEWLEDLHEGAASLMLAIVGVHVAAVVVSSRLHRENLVRAMITGRKQGRPQEGIRSAWRSVAALLLAAVLGFWWLQWQGAPDAGDGAATVSSQVAAGRHDGH